MSNNSTTATGTEVERYSHNDQDFFRKLVIERREKIIKELGLLTAITRNSTREFTGDSSTYTLHPADQGTDAQEREKAFMFASREGRYLKYLDRSLRKIEDGSFGFCEDCSEPIQKKRLEIVPTARLCVACKTKEEKLRRT